jgi:hypothetical protein
MLRVVAALVVAIILSFSMGTAQVDAEERPDPYLTLSAEGSITEIGRFFPQLFEPYVEELSEGNRHVIRITYGWWYQEYLLGTVDGSALPPTKEVYQVPIPKPDEAYVLAWQTGISDTFWKQLCHVPTPEGNLYAVHLEDQGRRSIIYVDYVGFTPRAPQCDLTLIPTGIMP